MMKRFFNTYAKGFSASAPMAEASSCCSDMIIAGVTFVASVFFIIGLILPLVISVVGLLIILALLVESAQAPKEPAPSMV